MKTISLALLIFSSVLCAGAWPAGEQRVAAYYFNEEVFDVSKLKSPAVQRAARPFVSRFLGEADVLWDLTAQFREGKVVGEKGEVIVNATRSRFVVKGSQSDHLKFETLWRSFEFWTRPSVEFEFLRVPCKEPRLVSWTAKELKKRHAVSIYHMEETYSYARRSLMRNWEEEGCAGNLEVTMYAHRGSAELRVDLRVSIPRELELSMGLSLQVNDSVSAGIELGALNAQEVLVLKTTVTERFMDRTAVARAIEFEDGEDQFSFSDEQVFGYDYQRNLGDGRSYLTMSSPLQYLEYLGDEAEESDPFETGEMEKEKIDWSGYPVVYTTKPVPGFVRPYVVYEVRKNLETALIESPDDDGFPIEEESLFWQEKESGVLTAIVDEQTGDNIITLLGMIGQDPIRWRRPLVVSLVEWEGDRESDELVPEGYRRLARLGALLRSNQMQSMSLLRSEGKDQLETEFIAEVYEFHLRVAVDFAEGDRLTTKLAMEETEARLIPLGRVDGKNRGILLEMKKVKLDGTAWPRDLR